MVGAAREVKRKGKWGERNSNPLPFMPDVVLATNVADRAEALWREYFSVVPILGIESSFFPENHDYDRI